MVQFQAFSKWFSNLVVCCQLICGRDAAVHAHAPTETPHHQDRGAVHHQSQVSAHFMTAFPAQLHSNFCLSVCFLYFRLLVKLPEVDYQLKVKTTFDKYVFCLNHVHQIL